MYNKGLTPNDLFQKGAMKAQEKNIMNTTMAKVKEDILSYESENEDRVLLLVDALNKYPEIFYASYMNYLDNTFKISIDLETVLTDEIEKKDNKETKDSAFNKSANEYDQKDSAPNAIKILIASLPDFLSDGTVRANDLGLPVGVDYNTTFNFIQQKLVDLPPDSEIMIDKLKELASIIPAFNILVERLNFGTNYTPGTGQNYWREQLLRTQFVNQFNKAQNEYTLHKKDEDGNITVLNSNADKLEDYILKEWQNNFEEIINNNPNAYKDILASRRKGKKELVK